jgi:hypothetical protein
MQDYVDQRNGGYYLRDSRVALDGVIRAFQRGTTPENILHSFPAIGSLVRVYGALTFDLENQAAVDQYLVEQDELAEKLSAIQSLLPRDLAERIRSARNDRAGTNLRT